VQSRAVWADRYAIFGEIATGGMATVYLGGWLGQPSGRRVVAVKKLFEQYAKQPEFVAMFLDEARLAARIRHPNVVNTYQYLKVPDSLAIVMEFVVGVPLNELIKLARQGEIPTPHAVTVAVLSGALAGLEAAHQSTDETGQALILVHRDISPHNVIVSKDGTPRVIDFGIAKAVGRLQVTETGVVKGKFAYMAPEQIRGEHVDRRVDVYAVGVVAWEMLAGRRLFQGSSDAEVLTKRASGVGPPPPPSSVDPSIPKALDDVVLRALADRPDDRFATAKEMAEALRGCITPARLPEVAGWVLNLAESRLAEIEAKHEEVERAFETGELAGLVSASSAAAAKRGPGWDRPSGSSVVFEAESLSMPTPLGLSSKAGASKAGAGTHGPSRSGMRYVEPEVALEVSAGGDLKLELDHSAPPQAGWGAAPDDLAAADGSGPKSVSGTRPPVASSRSAIPSAVPSSPSGRMAVPSRPSEREASSPSIVPPSLQSTRTALSTEKKPARSTSPSGLSRALRALYVRFFELHIFDLGGARGTISMISIGAVVAVTVSALWIAPAVLRGVVSYGAARRGLTASAQSISLGFGSLVLHGVAIGELTANDVTLHAPELEVDLGWTGSVSKVRANGFEVDIDGTVSDVTRRFAEWRKQERPPIAFEGTSGRLVWSNPLVPGVTLTSRDAQLGGDFAETSSLHFDTKVLYLGVKGNELGPWTAHLDSSEDETNATISLAPGASPALTLLSRPSIGQILSVALTGQKLAEIGVPPEFVGLSPDARLDVALQGQVSPGGEPMSAQAKIGVSRMKIPVVAGSASEVAVVVEGEFGGDSSRPLELRHGKIQAGDVTTALAGTVTFNRDGLLIELNRARPYTDAPFTLTFDTRAWTR